MGAVDFILENSYSLAAAIICISCFVYTLVINQHTSQKIRSRIYMTIIVAVFLGCIVAMLESLFRSASFSPDVQYRLVSICRHMYFFIHLIIMGLFFVYVIYVCDNTHLINTIQAYLFFVPFVLLDIAVIINPFTHFLFTLDEDYNYVRGVGVYLGYVLGVIYLVISIRFMAKHFKGMSALQKAAFIYFLVFLAIMIYAQVAMPVKNTELLGDAIGSMGLLIMVERDEFRMDPRTNALNRNALIKDLKNYCDYGKAINIFCIRLLNPALYRKIIGYDSYDMIMTEVVDYLYTVEKSGDVYRTTDANFYLICPEISEKKEDELLRKIKDRFDKDFVIVDGTAKVDASVLSIKCPDDVKDPNDILLFSETDQEFFGKDVMSGNNIDSLLRRIDVEKAIVRGIEGESFEVMYRPVYDMNTRQIRAAETILVLNDRVVGEVSFTEYIEVAQEMGLVTDLEYRMIDSVARFINTGIEHSGIEMTGLIIHIMSVRVITHELVEKVWEYIDSLQIDPGMIILDVADTVAVQLQDVLTQIIDEFDDIGVKVGLINNDAGLFGLSHALIEKMRAVTINVERHYAITDTQQSDMILRNRIAMIHQLGKIVVLGDVNSEVLYDRVKDMKADYIVGNYLSKRVTRNELQNKFWHSESIDEILSKE